MFNIPVVYMLYIITLNSTLRSDTPYFPCLLACRKNVSLWRIVSSQNSLSPRFYSRLRNSEKTYLLKTSKTWASNVSLDGLPFHHAKHNYLRGFQPRIQLGISSVNKCISRSKSTLATNFPPTQSQSPHPPTTLYTFLPNRQPRLDVTLTSYFPPGLLCPQASITSLDFYPRLEKSSFKHSNAHSPLTQK